MAMSNGEADALNTVMHWILGMPRHTGPVQDEDAKREAMWLMDRARKVLMAGLRADDVAEHWPEVEPRTAATDRAFVVQAIEAWQDGADPGDTLRAIRDQLAGRTPGKEAP